jgi:hypothetical protein
MECNHLLLFKTNDEQCWMKRLDMLNLHGSYDLQLATDIKYCNHDINSYNLIDYHTNTLLITVPSSIFCLASSNSVTWNSFNIFSTGNIPSLAHCTSSGSASAGSLSPSITPTNRLPFTMCVNRSSSSLAPTGLTPTCNTCPFFCRASRHCASTATEGDVSKICEQPSPPGVSSLIAAAMSFPLRPSDVDSNPTVAPCCLARSILDCSRSTARICFTPRCFAAQIPASPTPPSPITATTSSGPQCPTCVIAPAPVMMPHPSGANAFSSAASRIKRVTLAAHDTLTGTGDAKDD